MSATSRQRELLLFATIAFCYAVAPTAVNLFLPAIPMMADAFKINAASAQLSVSVYLTSFALVTLVSGPVLDRFDRVRVLHFALFSVVASSVIAAASADFLFLVCCRAVQGAAAALVTTACRMLIAERYPGPEMAKVMGRVTVVMMGSTLLSASTGGNLAESFGWRAGFLVCGAVAAVAMLVSRFVLDARKPRAQSVPPAPTQSLRSLLRSQKFISLAVQSCASYSLFQAFVSCAPHILRASANAKATVFSHLFAILYAGYFVGSLALGARRPRMLSAIDAHSVALRIQLIGASLALVIAAVRPDDPLFVFISIGMVSVAQGVLLPSVFSKAVSLDRAHAGSLGAAISFLPLAASALAVQLSVRLPLSNWIGITSCAAVLALVAMTSSLVVDVRTT